MDAADRKILRGIALFAIPLAGAYLPIGLVDLLVPRSQKYADIFTAKLYGPVSLGADVAASFYYVAVSGAITTVACAICIWFCAQWLMITGLPEATKREQAWIWIGIAIAVLLPLACLIFQLRMPDACNRIGIDDCLAKTLFMKTIKKTYEPGQELHFAMNQDINFLAYLVFTTYLWAVVTTSTAASSFRPRLSGTEKNPPAQGEFSGAASERAATLNVILYLLAAVLVAAMVTVKFRFDVGLATLGPPPTEKVPNIAFTTYQTIASGIMAYWAAVLSLYLALVYLPSSYVLREADNMSTSIGSFFSLNRENGIRLLKLAAILSPPIVNKLIETFATLPKGA